MGCFSSNSSKASTKAGRFGRSFQLGAGFVGAGLSIAGCLQQVSTGTGTTDPTAGTTTTTTSSTAAPSGAGCTTDPQTQITLCEQSSACPGVDVDQGAFPGCGFRLHADSVIDLECLCGDSLCAIGVPDTCSQATQLLMSQTSITVCEEASEGHCVQVGSPDAGTTGTTTTSASPCDKPCETECAGEPDCIQLCGC